MGAAEVQTISMGEDGILEAASENQAKKKRGRPGVALWSSADKTAWMRRLNEEMGFGEPQAYCFSAAKTLRGIQNSEYAFWAQLSLSHSLDEHPELGLLIGFPEANIMEATAIQKRNLGILSELGRIVKSFQNGEDACLSLALEYVAANPRPPVKEVIKGLRRYRLKNLGKPIMEPVGTLDGLRGAIIDAMLGYLDKNSGMGTRDVVAVLNELYCFFRRAIQEGED
jgi:hypothetical protein